MTYSSFQNMCNNLNLAREDIGTSQEELQISQELFDSTVTVNFPVTHDIKKFNGCYKTLNKFIDAIGYDGMSYSEVIPGPVGDQNSLTAKGIKFTESLIKKAVQGTVNGSKMLVNKAFPDFDVTINKAVSDIKMDESGRKHSFVLLDLSSFVSDIKNNLNEEVVAYDMVDYTKKYSSSDELGEWLCKRFKLFPTKKDYIDHIHRWWSDAGERDLIKKTEKKYDSCREAIMEIADLIYNKILESKK